MIHWTPLNCQIKYYIWLPFFDVWICPRSWSPTQLRQIDITTPLPRRTWLMRWHALAMWLGGWHLFSVRIPEMISSNCIGIWMNLLCLMYCLTAKWHSIAFSILDSICLSFSKTHWITSLNIKQQIVQVINAAPEMDYLTLGHLAAASGSNTCIYLYIQFVWSLAMDCCT